MPLPLAVIRSESGEPHCGQPGIGGKRTSEQCAHFCSSTRCSRRPCQNGALSSSGVGGVVMCRCSFAAEPRGALLAERQQTLRRHPRRSGNRARYGRARPANRLETLRFSAQIVFMTLLALATASGLFTATEVAISSPAGTSSLIGHDPCRPVPIRRPSRRPAAGRSSRARWPVGCPIIRASRVSTPPAAHLAEVEMPVADPRRGRRDRHVAVEQELQATCHRDAVDQSDNGHPQSAQPAERVMQILDELRESDRVALQRLVTLEISASAEGAPRSR